MDIVDDLDPDTLRELINRAEQRLAYLGHGPPPIPAGPGRTNEHFEITRGPGPDRFSAVLRGPDCATEGAAAFAMADMLAGRERATVAAALQKIAAWIDREGRLCDLGHHIRNIACAHAKGEPLP